MSNGAKGKQGEERRRAKRIAVQESFSFFLVIPKKLGMSRIYMRDISTNGISFWSEQVDQFAQGNELQVRLYTSPALYLPIAVTVVRVKPNEVAVEFKDLQSDAVRALSKFLDFLDLSEKAAVFEQADI